MWDLVEAVSVASCLSQPSCLSLADLVSLDMPITFQTMNDNDGRYMRKHMQTLLQCGAGHPRTHPVSILSATKQQQDAAAGACRLLCRHLQRFFARLHYRA